MVRSDNRHREQDDDKEEDGEQPCRRIDMMSTCTPPQDKHPL